MARGKLGGPRPLADDEVVVQFSVLTSEELANEIGLGKIMESMRRSGNRMVVRASSRALGDVGISGVADVTHAEVQFDSRTNNLNFGLSLSVTGINVSQLLSFVEETHSELVEMLRRSTGESVSEVASDNPPETYEFQLIDQGGLEENVWIGR